MKKKQVGSFCYITQSGGVLLEPDGRNQLTVGPFKPAGHYTRRNRPVCCSCLSKLPIATKK